MTNGWRKEELENYETNEILFIPPRAVLRIIPYKYKYTYRPVSLIQTDQTV